MMKRSRREWTRSDIRLHHRARQVYGDRQISVAQCPLCAHSGREDRAVGGESYGQRSLNVTKGASSCQRSVPHRQAAGGESGKRRWGGKEGVEGKTKNRTRLDKN